MLARARAEPMSMPANHKQVSEAGGPSLSKVVKLCNLFTIVFVAGARAAVPGGDWGPSLV